MSQKNPFASWAALISSLNETLEQRHVREAQKNSAHIDKELEAARHAARQERKERIKMLVLGQSESGASRSVSLLRIPC